MESVRKHGPMHDMFDKKTSSDGKFYFNLKTANSQVMGTSQRYAGEDGCDNGIDSTKRHATDAKVVNAALMSGPIRASVWRTDHSPALSAPLTGRHLQPKRVLPAPSAIGESAATWS